MEDLAAVPALGERVPFEREALLACASPPLRNMATIVGVSAAIANAVYHATGRRIRSLPITVEQLL